MFADFYFKRFFALPESQKSTAPAEQQISIVIPSYNEPEITKPLNSLAACVPPKKPIEIIIVVNSPEGVAKERLEQNQKSIAEIKAWKTQAPTWIYIQVIEVKDIKRKHAGAGNARKIGMDEAVHHFNAKEMPSGYIVNLDADCTVEPNYLQEIEKTISSPKPPKAFNIYFEHPLHEGGIAEKELSAIEQYELFLRAYMQAQRILALPFAYHTVGSCFGVNAEVYCKEGGMNRRTAGEDFYFLQKVIPLGSFIEINTTAVYPSARVSDRVPFGTGAAIRLFVDDNKPIDSYAPKLFDDLSVFLSKKLDFFKKQNNELQLLIETQPASIQEFLIETKFLNEIEKINQNSPNEKVFTTRFFQWFNAFKMMRYLNTASEKHYPKTDVMELVKWVLSKKEISFVGQDYSEMLKLFREMEK